MVVPVVGGAGGNLPLFGVCFVKAQPKNPNEQQLHNYKKFAQYKKSLGIWTSIDDRVVGVIDECAPLTISNITSKPTHLQDAQYMHVACVVHA